MLSNNNDKNFEDVSNQPINLPSNFHMPTNYEALCQLLEHNHQHHFKSINEMCYGCDKLDNNKNIYSEQENETLNEKIEHIQPQNHEHLCSLHALQFYPCLEDNMDIIGELNTYANLDENSVDKGDNSTVEDVPNTILTSKPLANDLIQQNVTINNINQNNTFLANNIQTKDSYVDKSNSLSMIIPSDYTSNNDNNTNLLIQNGQLNNIKENNDSSKQLIDDLLKNQNKNIKSVYNVIDNLSLLNGQKLNQQISTEPKTYVESLNPLNTTTDNIKNIYEILNMKNLNENQQEVSINTTSKSYDYILNNDKTTEMNNINDTSYPTTIPLMNNEKITTSIPSIYTKSHSLPIYPQKDLAGSSSSILNKSNDLNTLVKSEIKNELTSSPGHINISNSLISNPLLNQPLTNVTTNPSLTFPQPSSLNPTTYPNTNFNTTSTTNIPTTLMNSLPQSTTPNIPNKNEEKHLNIIPKTKETKSRFTSVARTVAPPLKVNPPKTYVKNTTIRNKSTTIDPEEKRRRNTEASARFRARKKFTEIMLKQQTHDLSCKCCELEKQLAEAKREIYWLKQLLIAKQS
eukprot:jgi/Orpsp1_1/1180791/evm.model.c7180000074635.2